MVRRRLQGDQLSLLNDFSLPNVVPAAVAPGAAAPHPANASMTRGTSTISSTEITSGSALEHSPEQKTEPCPSVPRQCRSGWIEQYKVKRRESEYLYFRYCYRDGYRGKTHHHHLKPTKIAAVRALIASGASVDEILSVIQ